MKILICPDKFKECLTARQVAGQLQTGFERVLPDAVYRLLPMADGGDGTVDALLNVIDGHIEQVVVHDPLMRRVSAHYAISADGNTAVIETAAASGLALLKKGERNPLITTSYGAGELIKSALDKGCRDIIVGLGGSATIDGGVGMARALGIKFTDALGNETGPGGGSLGVLYHIDMTGIDPRIEEARIQVACDVDNRLTGKEGATLVFGPQKGANPSMARKLEDNLLHLSRVIAEELGKNIAALKGGGAAGGMGAAMTAFLGGELKPGFELVSQLTGLEKWIEWADLVITGEGRIDSQTAYGKTPAGVARLAARYAKPALAFAGEVERSSEKHPKSLFTAIIPIADRPMTLEQSINDAGSLLAEAGARTAQIIRMTLFFPENQVKQEENDNGADGAG